MKTIRWIIGLIVLVLFLGACEELDLSEVSDADIERISEKVIVCERPYMRFASGCCLDVDDNNICDADEQTEKPKDEPELPEEPEEEPDEPSQDAEREPIKTASPHVELFVMSHCPYALQMEKGILPVVELLEDNIDFEIKFLSYAMHGEDEILEQLRQYCIKKEQEDRYIDYLKCFIRDGSGCLDGIGDLEECEEETDRRYGIIDKMKNPGGRFPSFPIYEDECEKYGIRGSPTLVINSQEVRSSRSPSALLDVICGHFEEAPEECDEELSEEVPVPGFQNSA